MRRWALCAAVAALGLVAPGGSAVAAAPWTSGAIHGLVAWDRLAATPAAPDRIYLLLQAPPTDEAPQILLVSDDRGLHWARRSLPEHATSLDVATGPPELLLEISRSGRIFRSSDQGRNWAAGGCCASTIDVGDPERVFGVHDDVPARSIDGGATWQPAGPLPFPAFVTPAFRFGGGTLWATTENGAVARSADAGLTWQVVTGVPEGTLTPVEGVPGHLFAGLWRSFDDAASWQRSPLPPCGATIIPVRGSVTAWADACEVPYRTADGGATWTEVGPAPFVRDLTPIGDGTQALVIGLDGPWLIGGGAPPSYRGDALEVLAPQGLLPDPRVPGRAEAGTWSTTDAGATWRPSPTPWVPFGHVGRRTVVFSQLTGEFRTEPDGGGPPTRLAIAPYDFLFDPGGRQVWALVGHRVLRSSDGQTFRTLPARGLPHPPLDFETGSGIFAGGAGGRSRTVVLLWSRGEPRSRLVVSRDGGRSFRVVDPRPLSFAFARIAVDAIDGRLMIATDDRGLRVSRNAGRTFRRSLAGAGAAIAVDPTRRGVWFAARRSDVYVTRNAGRTWHRLARPGGGVVTELAVGARRLWALTSTRLASLPIGGTT